MKVLYINLDRRPDRREAIEQNLKEMGVPESKIERFPAVDRDDFDSPHEIIAYARSLGHEHFKKSLETGKQLKYLAYNLSYYMALCHIDNQHDWVLLMDDDYFLTESYSDIQESLGMLPLTDFKLAMLGYGWHSELRIWSEFRPCASMGENSKWQYGAPQRGTAANVFTLKGARWLRDVCKDYSDKTVETVIRDVVPTAPGVYSRKPDYICIEESHAVGDSDVMNEKGDNFEMSF